MVDPLKIVISGLQNAGKTSILTALDKKYDFVNEVHQLKPTIKVEYRRTSFLGRETVFWDMGGQEKYRNIYLNRPEIYFAGTNLIIYTIDIQDREKFDESLNYLDTALEFFTENEISVPLIVTFHKYDPKLRSYDQINEDIEMLRREIKGKFPSLNILFQQTSIYDIISIVQLISYGLSVFDGKFFELSLYMETSLEKLFDCSALILFDKNGIIISEFYTHELEPEYYFDFLEKIREHIYLLKRMEEEEQQQNFFTTERGFLSYLHQIDVNERVYYISVILSDQEKDEFMENFSPFVEKLKGILISLDASFYSESDEELDVL